MIVIIDRILKIPWQSPTELFDKKPCEGAHAASLITVVPSSSAFNESAYFTPLSRKFDTSGDYLL